MPQLYRKISDCLQAVVTIVVLVALVFFVTPIQAASVPTSPEAILLAARAAANQGDVNQLKALELNLNLVDGQHVLRIYPEYWALQIQLKRSADQAMDVVTADSVRNFLMRNANTFVADAIRRNWLLVLAKRGDFETFDAEYQKLKFNDDAQIDCYRLLSDFKKHQEVSPAAQVALMAPRDFGVGCSALAEALSANGQLSTTTIWSMVRRAFEFNLPEAAKRYATLLPRDLQPSPKLLDIIYERPSSWLAKFSRELDATQHELVVLALGRMAQQNPAQTAIFFQQHWLKPLTPAQRAYVWAHIAAFASKKMVALAPTWSRYSLSEAKLTNQLSDEVLAWQTRGALRAQDWILVNRLIEAMPERMQRGYDGTWVYWLARSLKAQGQTGQAENLLRSLAGQFNFYGQLALEELGERIKLPARSAALSEAEMNAIQQTPGLKRALAWYQMGARMLGNLEWNYTLRDMSDRQLLAAAEWARQNDLLDRAVNTADRTKNQHDFSLRFLAPFQHHLQPTARQFGLDLAWVYGLIRQESRFITTAQSVAGAAGLMQIMPATAHYVAQKMKLRDYHPGKVLDPETNLLLGTRYLAMVFNDLDHQPILATAAYNAGPSRPRAWRATLAKPIEGAIFAETIPFNETRDYVKKVMSNTAYYAVLFGSPTQSLKQRLGVVTP